MDLFRFHIAYVLIDAKTWIIVRLVVLLEHQRSTVIDLTYTLAQKMGVHRECEGA